MTASTSARSAGNGTANFAAANATTNATTNAAKPAAPAAAPPPGRWQGTVLQGCLGVQATAWDALNRQHFRNHPLLDSRHWNALLRQAAGRPVQLWALHDGAKVLAMCLLQPLGWGRWQSFNPPGAGMAPVLVPDPALIEVLMAGLGPAATQLDLMALDPAVQRTEVQPGGQTRVTLSERTMSVDTRGDFDSYLAQRPASLRQAARRLEQSALAAGVPGVHRMIDQAPDLQSAVRHYLDLLARTPSDGDGGPAIPSAAPSAAPSGISPSAAIATPWLDADAAGRVVVHEWWTNAGRVASRLVLQVDDRWLVLKAAGDAAGDGARLLQALLQQAFANPVIRQVDFSGDAAPAHRPWSTDFRWQRHHRQHPAGMRGQAARLLDTARRVLAAPARSGALPAGVTASRLPLDAPWPNEVSALFAQAARDSLEISQPWYDNLFQTVFKAHPDAALWVLSKGGQMVAAIPVLVDPAGPGQRLTALSNYYTAYFMPTLAPGVRGEDLALLLRQILRHHRRLGSMRFEPLDPQADGFHRLVQALELNGLACVHYFKFANWYLPAQASYAHYLKGRSASLRSTLKRMSKRSQDEGGRIEVITDPDDVARGMAGYWQVYRQSWKQDEPYPAFIDGLATWAAAQGVLRLGVLWLNDAPVAAQLWLVAHARCEIVKVAYDDAHKALSPGTVLTAVLLERVIDQDQVTEVDFLIGDDSYKRNWMSHRRERWGVLALDPRRVVGLLGLAREVAGWLRHQVRSRLPRRAPAKADPA